MIHLYTTLGHSWKWRWISFLYAKPLQNAGLQNNIRLNIKSYENFFLNYSRRCYAKKTNSLLIEIRTNIFQYSNERNSLKRSLLKAKTSKHLVNVQKMNSLICLWLEHILQNENTDFKLNQECVLYLLNQQKSL